LCFLFELAALHVGNPFGLDHTLTTGVISGLGREIASGNTGRPIDGIIQTAGAGHPSTSLLNMDHFLSLKLQQPSTFQINLGRFSHSFTQLRPRKVITSS
jgi:hypothetical protein